MAHIKLSFLTLLLMSARRVCAALGHNLFENLICDLSDCHVHLCNMYSTAACNTVQDRQSMRNCKPHSNRKLLHIKFPTHEPITVFTTLQSYHFSFLASISCRNCCL